MWTCSRCGRRFANTNQWHSCLELDVEEHLAPHSPQSVELYRLFQAAVEECGEFRIHAQKTRIAFIARMTFAAAKLAQHWIDINFITPGVIDDRRINSIELFGPTSFGNTMRLTGAADLDEEVRSWLCVAWRRGTQETLDPGGGVALVAGQARTVLTVPLATRAQLAEDELVIRLPGYAAAALGEGARVSARVSRSEPAAAEVVDGTLRFGSGYLREQGLGDGDEVDVVVTPS